MSLMTMKRMAIERDVRAPRKTVSKKKRGEEAIKPATNEKANARDVLVSAIPTEVLAPYTALVAGVVATIDAGESERLVMRWILYAAGAVFIVAYLGLSYRRQKEPTASRKFPWAETTASVLAFGAWGLVMPGSPLAAILTGDDLVIWTLVLTIGGAAVIGLLGGTQLNKKTT